MAGCHQGGEETGSPWYCWIPGRSSTALWPVHPPCFVSLSVMARVCSEEDGWSGQQRNMSYEWFRAFPRSKDEWLGGTVFRHFSTCWCLVDWRQSCMACSMCTHQFQEENYLAMPQMFQRGVLCLWCHIIPVEKDVLLHKWRIWQLTRSIHACKHSEPKCADDTCWIEESQCCLASTTSRQVFEGKPLMEFEMQLAGLHTCVAGSRILSSQRKTN